jgi:hypothetical protein
MKIHTAVLVLLKFAIALLFLTGCSHGSGDRTQSTAACYAGNTPGSISITAKPQADPTKTQTAAVTLH